MATVVDDRRCKVGLEPLPIRVDTTSLRLLSLRPLLSSRPIVASISLPC